MTGKECKKKEIHQLWNLTGIDIEQRGLFTKHPMDGNGASPAAVPTPLAGAKSGDFEVEACPQNDVTMLVVL